MTQKGNVGKYLINGFVNNSMIHTTKTPLCCVANNAISLKFKLS